MPNYPTKEDLKYFDRWMPEFWFLYWQKQRGGHYYFELPRQEE